MKIEIDISGNIKIIIKRVKADWKIPGIPTLVSRFGY